MINNFWLITNYSCNNRCRWCYTLPEAFSNDTMKLNYAKEVMKELKDNGANKCTLIGGESTLFQHLIELIKYGRQLGLFMKLVTNGRLLSDIKLVRRLKKADVSLIAISLHSFKASTHNKITQTNSYKEVIQGIKNCLQEKINFLTLTTINSINKNDIFNTAKFLIKIGVKTIIFNIAAPSMGDRDMTKFVLAPDKITKIITKNFKLLKASGIKAVFYATTPLCLYEEDDLREMISSSYLKTLSTGECNVFYGSGFGLDPWGNLIPCTHMVKNKLLKTMDSKGKFLYKGKFIEMWNKVKNNFGVNNWKYPSNKCINCEYKKECIGGCPLFWREFEPKDFIK